MNTHKNFRSVAHWPDGTISDDDHETREQADAVCSMLRQQGLGGAGYVFPTRTEVIEPMHRMVFQLVSPRMSAENARKDFDYAKRNMVADVGEGKDFSSVVGTLEVWTGREWNIIDRIDAK